MLPETSLGDVFARLEKSVQETPGNTETPKALYDKYEMFATAYLDSEHANFDEGILAEALWTYMYLVSLCLEVYPEEPE